MLRSPRARLLVVLVLLAALFGLVVWHGTLTPAPDAGAYPGSEELAADYEAYLGEDVTVGGRIVETDPVVVEAEYGVEEPILLTVVGLDPGVTVEKDAHLRVFGTVEPDRTVRAENAFAVPPIGPLYAWTISFLAGLWVLGRIVRRFRVDREEWGLVPREAPLTLRAVLGRDRSQSSGGSEDA
ncbi:MAG: hypothetical protein ABEH88_03250 [Halobacteriales archaeon]